MAIQFKSVSELKRFIKNAQANATVEMGKDLEEIVKETTKENLYGRYSPSYYDRKMEDGGMLSMIRATEMTPNSVTVAIEDTGAHRSWKSPYSHVYVAKILEEGGHTWEKGGERKPPTRIIEDSKETARDEMPESYIRAMASQGIEVRKK